MALDKIKFATLGENLKKNWYFPISAMAFFCLTVDNSLGYFLGLILVLGIMILIAARINSIRNIISNESLSTRLFYGLSAIGICWGNQQHFYAQILKLMFPGRLNIIFLCVSILGAIVAFYFVYVCLSIFWRSIARTIENSGVFKDIGHNEAILYALMLLVSLLLVTIAFLQTDAFYGTEYPYDIIYTSDSPSLVKDNVFLTLTHPENDLRQPLFAVFAAPFVGIPYLIGKILGAPTSVQAMLMNYIQIAMLFTANFMLTKMMKFTPLKRVCFMLLTCCTYSHLLFTLIMEQYIVAYFWLILCVYLICEKNHPNRIALWGAGGTLLTSIILLPLMSQKSVLKDFKSWIKDIVRYGIEFIALMLVFCRFDVIYNLTSRLSFLGGFTGKNVTLIDKFFQYTDFIKNCFIAPNAGVNFTAVDHVSWQLNEVTGVSIAGIVILVLSIISTVLNRDKKSSLLAAGWVGYSIIMLFILGWGTQENGLILYSLYFGWAFLVLLFQLVEKIESKLNIKFLLPVLCIGGAVALSVLNIPAILDMLNFAITYFPL